MNLPTFLFNLDFWNFVIAVVALVVAIYSVWYTKRRDKFTLELDNCCYERHRDYAPIIFSFDVVNNSSAGIRILAIEFDLNTVSYDPFEENRNRDLIAVTANYEYDSQFTGNEFLESQARKSYSYFIAKPQNTVTLTITADKPLKWWSKSKSFTIHPSDFNQ